MSGIAEVLLAHGFEVTRLGPRASRDHARALASSARTIHDRPHAPRTCASADVVVFSSAVKRDNPELVEARGARHPGHPARRDARRADAPARRHRHRRLARQDHHHLAGRDRAARGRPRPDRRSSAASSTCSARNAARGTRRSAGRRGRRVRRLVPAPDARRSRWSPTSTPSTSITTATTTRVKDAFVEFANRVPFYGLVVRVPRSPARAGHPAAHREARRHLRPRGAGRLPRAQASSSKACRRSFELVRRGKPLGRVRGAHAGHAQRAQRAGRRSRSPTSSASTRRT